MSAPDLARTIREVKAQVPMPVTYADVWEFWLRYRDVAAAVDFITIHILPYWEDFPIPAREAAAHVDAIRKKVVAAFPGRDIFLGEFGWPSAGRMREGALPSPVNQARTIHDVLALAKRENYPVNLIEAYDQPWKRQLEGTVGGHWGSTTPIDARPNSPGAARLQPSALALAGGRRNRLGRAGLRGRLGGPPWQRGAGCRPVAAHRRHGVRIRKRDRLDHRQCPARKPHRRRLGPLARLGGGRPDRPDHRRCRRRSRGRHPELRRRAGAQRGSHAWAAGARPRRGIDRAGGSIGAGGARLVFDPRYRDFPFAPLTGAVTPFLLIATWQLRVRVRHPAAESVAAATLALSAIYIVLNEGFANWQALWFCAGLIALALTLLQARDAPGSG